jgi:hypothetical protein
MGSQEPQGGFLRNAWVKGLIERCGLERKLIQYERSSNEEINRINGHGWVTRSGVRF